MLPSPLPMPMRLTKPEPASLKRAAPDDDDDDILISDEPPAKRARINGAPAAASSPSKSGKLDQDGLELIEDDDVILVE